MTARRMCSKCGINPPRSPQASVCKVCAQLGAAAPVDPAAARAAATYDREHGRDGPRPRPDVMTHRRMAPAARTAPAPETRT